VHPSTCSGCPELVEGQGSPPFKQSPERGWRVAAVASHPIQYQAPWFRALAGAVDLDVFFCHRQDAEGQAAAGYGTPFEWDVPLLDGYRHHWLENRSARPNVSSYGGCDTPGVDAALGDGQFDACIVNGWYLKSYLQAVRACRRHHIRVLVRGDSHLGTPRSPVKSALKWLPYRLLLDRVDAHLYVGQANKAYLKHYGVPEQRLFFVPHFVDNAFFADRAEAARREGQAGAIRSELGIRPESTVALFVGRLVPMKRPEDFVAGVGLAARAGSPVEGIVVGSGPLLDHLQSLGARTQAPIRFAGFRNQTELPAFYAAADVLVLPSDGRETWGLVVNEAMACGLPAIVSSAAGCAPDLIEDGATGYTFPCGNVPALSERLALLARELQARRGDIVRSVRSRIAGYSCSAAVEATLGALERVCPRVEE